MMLYFCKRILYGIPVLITVATLTFGIMHLVPGGPFDTEKKLPPEIIANIEAKYHLNEPLVTQYFLYMKQILGPGRGVSGRSIDGHSVRGCTRPRNVDNEGHKKRGLCSAHEKTESRLPTYTDPAFWLPTLRRAVCFALPVAFLSYSNPLRVFVMM